MATETGTAGVSLLEGGKVGLIVGGGFELTREEDDDDDEEDTVLFGIISGMLNDGNCHNREAI